MKKCFKCGIAKPLDEFYAHPQMGDGHLNKCKECTKRDVRAHRATHREQLAEYERERLSRPERRAQHDRQRVGFRERYPEKTRAHNAVARAIRTGRLVQQPCERCGGWPVDGHHDDYSKPLDVRWLCRRCHHDLHAEQRVA